MARFVLRYRGDRIEKARDELAAIVGLVIVEISGRNFLVEADAERIRSALGDSERWVASAETLTPPPKPPRLSVKKTEDGGEA
jgi:hypothetical protein